MAGEKGQQMNADKVTEMSGYLNRLRDLVEKERVAADKAGNYSQTVHYKSRRDTLDFVIKLLDDSKTDA